MLLISISPFFLGCTFRRSILILQIEMGSYQTTKQRVEIQEHCFVRDFIALITGDDLVQGESCQGKAPSLAKTKICLGLVIFINF